MPVDKSHGLSTYDAVRRFKRCFRKIKIGHSGTLDPQATGLVLLLTGEATKLSGYLMDLPKRYLADIVLGEATDTQDAVGLVVRAGDWSHVTGASIREAIERFVGVREQVPPMYSALKKDGRPLYVLARKGEEVDREPREVETYAIDLLEIDLPRIRIDIRCARGLYVRVLAEEIGDALGVPAHLAGLVRTEIGGFSLDGAISDAEFEALRDAGPPGVGLAEAVAHLPAVAVDGEDLERLGNGIAPRLGPPLPEKGSLVRLVRADGGLGAICEVGPAGFCKLRRVFHDRYAAERGV